MSSMRGQLGAVGSRLATSLSNLGVQQENNSAAESRIRDVDVSDEAAQLVRSQIIQQAAAAVLSQANRQSAIALQLLQR